MAQAVNVKKSKIKERCLWAMDSRKDYVKEKMRFELS
jgi:hypothetical protein